MSLDFTKNDEDDANEQPAPATVSEQFAEQLKTDPHAEPPYEDLAAEKADEDERPVNPNYIT